MGGMTRFMMLRTTANRNARDRKVIGTSTGSDLLKSPQPLDHIGVTGVLASEDGASEAEETSVEEEEVQAVTNEVDKAIMREIALLLIAELVADELS